MKEPPLQKLIDSTLRLYEREKIKKEKNMTNFVLSLIRTYVPIVVGALAAWLLTINIELDTQTQTGLVVALTGLLQAVYYTGIRFLEKKFPKIGVLLGSTKTPDYK